MSDKSVCIVGAGVAGLVTIKECKHVGLNPVCYELNSDLGGIWTSDRHGETSNTPRSWDSLITNTTKYVMTFSDYHVIPDTPQYMTREKLSDYYRDYAKYFDLAKHIRYNTRVVRINKTADHAKTGKWEVYTCRTSDFHDGNKRPGLQVSQRDLNLCHVEVFDVVLICSGFFKIPNYPDIPGLESFPGGVHHSFDYRSNKPFEDKQVLVVGNSFSAGDIACDISLVTNKPVELSLGQGTWIQPRVLPGGVSSDRFYSRKKLYNCSAERLNNEMIAMCQMRLDHIGSGINPALPPLNAPYMMGDDIYMKILTDQIRIQGELVGFKGARAEFRNCSISPDIDEVIFATGYSLDTSFLDMDVVLDQGKVELYHMMLPIREVHHTLAFIGFLGGDGPPAPGMELQARYIARLITGKIAPPSKKAMHENVELLAQLSMERKGKYTYHLPLFVISDMIAKDIGVYPYFWRVFFRDPILASRLHKGPIFSAQFRLLGPDSNWDTARATCYRAYDVMTASPNERGIIQIKRDDIRVSNRRRMLKLACGVLVVAALGYVALADSKRWNNVLLQRNYSL
ncbi:transposable element tc3 transposase [Plakobranchus ocellatus]|uniref:Flavin-containing monooxygenase n=1 Tax=Plakobranchus ocellatus TaxID=259542 RepID=A0AAV3XVJ0_9GAST|nr:transposable element tc3 transposase [Plakobranchus ocellatus]